MERKGPSSKAVKAIARTALILMALSALPLVIFYIRPYTPSNDTNESIVHSLQGRPGDRFAFIVIGDPEVGLFCNDASAIKLIRNINREGRFKKTPIDVVITTGDNVFRGIKFQYRILQKLRSIIRYPLLTTPGNHDFNNDGPAVYKEYCGATRYAFGMRNAYFIVLNDEEGDLSADDLKWFEEELNKGKAYDHRFVFLHKPPVNPYQQSWYRIETNDWPRRFMKLCEEHDVDIVFSGHEHMFKEMKLKGVRYVITGGAGMLPTYPSSDGGYIHYLSVSVNGPYVSYEVRRVTPPLWLYLTYYLWKDLFYVVKGFVV